jgi:hypothetical protein
MITGEPVAKMLMKQILYDNGAVSRIEPEYYDPEWVAKISPIALRFFFDNPTKLTDDDIYLICTADYRSVQIIYGALPGFADLHKILNEYFEQI